MTVEQSGLSDVDFFKIAIGEPANYMHNFWASYIYVLQLNLQEVGQIVNHHNYCQVTKQELRPIAAHSLR